MRKYAKILQVTIDNLVYNWHNTSNSRYSFTKNLGDAFSDCFKNSYFISLKIFFITFISILQKFSKQMFFYNKN